MSPSSPPQTNRNAWDVVDSSEVVALVPRTEAADRLIGLADGRGYFLKRRNDLTALGFEQLILGLPPGQDARGAIVELEGLERSATVGVNHAYRPQTDAAGRIYAASLLKWPSDGCPARMPVGMIDGVVDSDVPALQNARIIQRDFTGGNPAGHRHGTSVAEILAGPGRLTDVEILNAAVLGSREDTDLVAGVDALMRAFDWLSASGVRLVNVSLAGPYNKILDRGLQAAARNGMVVIAAAGNAGAGSPPLYPAAFSQTIAVTAIDAALAPYSKASTGQHIDFAAPGVDIYLQLAGRGRYLSGTSLATPFVTALVAEGAPLRSTEVIRQELARSAIDLGEEGPDEVFGFGLPQSDLSCRG